MNNGSIKNLLQKIRTICAGFSLLEMSVVLAIMGTVMGGGLVMLRGTIDSTRYNTTIARMDIIHKTLLDYSLTFNRMPCPASLTLDPTNTNYGIEAASNSNTCVGGTPAANFTSSGGAAEGAVPTRSLKLPDEYMYDGWGKRFRYAVNPTKTAASSFPPTSGTACSDGRNLTVNDATGAARSSAALYVLMSHGATGHGGYTQSGTIFSAGSTNTDEQTNCHCNASATATTYTGTYVQKLPTASTTLTNEFDDIVSYREAWQLQTPNITLGAAATCQYVYVVDAGNNRIQYFDLSGGYAGKWGSTGSGNGQFNFKLSSSGTGGITVAPDGTVYVADTDNDRIQHFSATGTYLGQFGTYGTGDGQLNGPFGVALDSAGNIWVTEMWGIRVQKFDSSGNYLLKLGSFGTGASQFNYPACIAANGNYVYVCDHVNQRVQQFDLNGNYVTSFTFPDTPIAERPWRGLSFDSGGNFYVSNSWTGGTLKYNAAGNYVSTYAPYSGGTANGFTDSYGSVAIGASDAVWVVDYGNNRIQKFNSAGVWQLSSGGPSPHTCNTSPSGSSPACASGSGDGQFNTAVAIAITGGYSR